MRKPTAASSTARSINTQVDSVGTVAAGTATTVTLAVAGVAPNDAGSVAVTVTGPPTATPAAWNVADVWFARMVTVVGTEATPGFDDVSVTIVSVDWEMLIVAVRLLLAPTTMIRDGGLNAIVTCVGLPTTSE